MKRAVYENLTKNFDIFEFLDDNADLRNNATRRNDPMKAADGDDEMSDELEFEIDDNNPHMESLYFDTEQIYPGGRRNAART